MVEDPRLAWIQLDYVLLVPRVIRRKPQSVCQGQGAPFAKLAVYYRMKQLEKTYE